MRIFARLLEKLYCVAAKYRCALIVVGAAALAALSVSISEPALANNECGDLDGSGFVSCSPILNPYPTGIGYNTDNTPITLKLPLGVRVTIPFGSPGVNAVNAANTTGPTATSAPITITANADTILNNINPSGSNQTGLRIQSSGDATITATNTTINLSGTASDFGLYAIVLEGGAPHNASVNFTQGTGLGLSTSSGIESGAIQADNRGNGNANIVASGAITVTPAVGVGNGTTQYGLLAHAGDPSLTGVRGAGNAAVTFDSGTLNVNAIRPRGILAWVDGNGSATDTTGVGTVINVSGTQFGGPAAYLFSSGTAAAPNTLTANVASQIMSVGPASTDPSNLPIGIKAVNSGTDAPIVVNYTGPGITTVGGNGSGIFATSGSGSIIVNASGPINTTDGSDAVGILADSGTALVYSSGVLAADITTIRPSPTSTTGSVEVTAANVSTLGQFGTGISATAGSGGVTVNILPGGSVTGGWQADLDGVGPTYRLPAAGVILGSSVGTATLNNDGSIGALSDRAVASSPLFPSNNTSIINNGTITGFMQLVGGNNSIFNNGTFNLRNFEDTTGAVGGVRDTVRVAIADLGVGRRCRDTVRVAIADLGVAQTTTSPTTERWRSPPWQAPRRWPARASISRSTTPTTKWRSAGRCRAT